MNTLIPLRMTIIGPEHTSCLSFDIAVKEHTPLSTLRMIAIAKARKEERFQQIDVMTVDFQVCTIPLSSN